MGFLQSRLEEKERKDGGLGESEEIDMEKEEKITNVI